MKYFAAAAVLGYANARLANPESRQPLSADFKPVIKNPLVPVNQVPETWIWNNVNGTNFLTNVRN
jgi:hypothetical protein